jgi:hypothetical protein
VALPERVPGFVVEAGRAVGHDLPSLDVRQSLAPWSTVIGGRGPFFVRLQGADPAAIAHVQRLARLGDLWLEAPLPSVDEALDLVVAGATRLVVPMGGDDDLVEALGPAALIDWDGRLPWPEVEAAALGHGVPVLARRPPPEGAACDAFVLDEGKTPGSLALRRVASAPEAPESTDDDGDAGGEGDAGDGDDGDVAAGDGRKTDVAGRAGAFGLRDPSTAGGDGAR